MIETAASLFCKPEIPVITRQHNAEGKTIVEVEVSKGDKRPYLAKGEDGRWKAYIRHKDQNFVANGVLLHLWRKNERKTGILIRFGRPENILMEYLKKNGSITLSGFKRLAKIPSYRAEKILVNLLLCKVLVMNISEKGYSYELSQPRQPI
jgi:predicted HTH transcriptional regulator